MNKNIDFVSIDFETATSKRSSICEIGISIVKDSIIEKKMSWLVRPENNEYDLFNIYIHGITPKMTENSKSFPDVWMEVEPYLSGNIVVAHNVAFDMYALKEALDKYRIEYPDFIFYCSYRIASYLLDSIAGYSLSALCDYYGIERETEHRALDDSAACAEIFIKCLKDANVDSLEELEEKYNFKHGTFKIGSFTSQKSTLSSVKAKDISADKSKYNPDSIFYGKNVCFTGSLKFIYRKDAMQLVADLGGTPSDTVTNETDILVVGHQDKRIVGEDGMSNKQKKAIKMIQNGHKIEIMQEAEFVKNIGCDKDMIQINNNV